MKKLFYLTLVGLAWLATPPARAWTYQDGDVLLIFRESGFNDVEFDIGAISQFLNHSDGYTTSVTDWDSSVVTNVFGSDLTGVSVILAATTSWTNTASARIAWLSSSSNVTVVPDVSALSWQDNLWSVIDAVGTRPETYLVTPTNSAYVLGPTDLGAYDFIVTGGGNDSFSIPKLGGHVSFDVEGIAPAALGFWQIQPTNAVPAPEAGYTGTFNIDTNGNLTFQAGLPPAPPTQITIVGFGRANNVSTVSFATVANGSYALVYTNALGAPIGSWPVVSGPLAGNGNTVSLSHTNSTDTAGFYGVIWSP
jgi:hypothetical protein